ncbi:hypothetical protein GGP41_000839 [Bipolaris sorokiniana]|uniref:Uncharacterized protein n=1 Tax=Cochliobolus sativus TaxID=45130 RepID=A0A8H6DXY5_COCSA|nr:hypothetical protein GGP41_000839 [Bipolaris sorokiniana]
MAARQQGSSAMQSSGITSLARWRRVLPALILPPVKPGNTKVHQDLGMRGKRQCQRRISGQWMVPVLQNHAGTGEPYVPCLPTLFLHHHSIDLTLIWLQQARLVGWAPRTAAAVPLQNSRSPIATAPHPHGWETKILPPVPQSRVRREPNQRIVTCCYHRVA